MRVSRGLTSGIRRNGRATRYNGPVIEPFPDLPEYKKLSVIVPVLNERNTVAEILRRMRAVELPAGLDREIIVVDDGSTDGSVDVLRQLHDSTVRVVTHEKNRGKGAALRTGFSHTTGDLILIQDADLEYDPEDWPKLIAPVLNGKAVVV